MPSLKIYNGGLVVGLQDSSLKCYSHNPGKQIIRREVEKCLTSHSILLTLACYDLCDVIQYSKIIGPEGSIIIAEREYKVSKTQQQYQHLVNCPIDFLSVGDIKKQLPIPCDIAFLDLTGCYSQNTRALLRLARYQVKEYIFLGVSDSYRSKLREYQPLFKDTHDLQANKILKDLQDILGDWQITLVGSYPPEGGLYSKRRCMFYYQLKRCAWKDYYLP